MKRKWVRRVQYVSHVIPEPDKKTLAYKPECIGHEAAQWIMGLLGHSSYEHKNGVFFIKGERLNGYGEFIKKVNEYRVKEGLPQFTKNPAWLHPEPEQISVHSKNPWHEHKMRKGGNPRVYDLVFATGMNVNDFLDAYGIPREGFYRIAKLGSNPRNPDGQWRVNTIRLAKALRMKPEDIFPEESACAE